MAKNIIELKTDGRGNYQRDIGWKPGKTKPVQHRFYFGTDRAGAQIRCLKTLRCWEIVEKRWNKKTPKILHRPFWEKETIAIAKAVAAGHEEIGLEPADMFDVEFDAFSDEQKKFLTQEFLSDFRELQSDFKELIKIRQAGDWPVEEKLEKVQQEIETAKEKIKEQEYLIHGPDVVTSNQSLHQALDSFHDWLGTNHQEQGKISETGRTLQRQIQTIKSHIKDISLEAFGLNEVDGWIDYWKNRPPSKNHSRKNQPVTRATAIAIIKMIRVFIKWLHRSKEYVWRKPEDYETKPIKIRLTQEERATKVRTEQVVTYSLEELTILWKYAGPRDRLLILLALNCGFGQREVGNLQLQEIFLEEKHGYYKNLIGSFVKRLRGKSEVYGEWQLWPETVQAIRWYLPQRKAGPTCLLVKKDGQSIITQHGRAPSSNIAHAWEGLYERIIKDHPDFRKLSFNKLRKTSGNLVRQIGGGELYAIHHAHGKSVLSDHLAEVYTNRPFDQLFEVHRKMREQLSEIFTIENPFPDTTTMKTRIPYMGLDKAGRILELRKEGKSYTQIAEEVGVSRDTVARKLRKAGLTKTHKTTQ